MKVVVGFCRCGEELAVDEKKPEYSDGLHTMACPKCHLGFSYKVRNGAVEPPTKGRNC